MKITSEMVSDFNQTLSNLNCCFKIELRKSVVGDNTICDIVLANNKYIDSFIINPSKEFFKDLEGYFSHYYDIELAYDNTRTTFWSKSGWDK
jgi:hypothetical protein